MVQSVSIRLEAKKTDKHTVRQAFVNDRVIAINDWNIQFDATETQTMQRPGKCIAQSRTADGASVPWIRVS
jgi:hypothetical protein